MRFGFRSLHLAGVLILFSSTQIHSQTLTANTAQLNFGNAYENAPDSLSLSIDNNMGHTVNVTGIKFYNTYASPAFSASSSSFSIADGASQTIWIKFSPQHNIFHNSEMVIENDGLRGYVNVDLLGQGKYSKTYYDTTENLSEENLKVAIHAMTGIGYNSLGYDIGRDSMFMWFDNQRTNGQGATQNTLECIYTGRLAVGYIDKTDAFVTYSINTEHTFPQSFFSSQEPMKSDLHHLFPCDMTANGKRDNNPFGIVSNATWSVGGSKGTTTLFEPRDQQKGRTARAMMYFVLRYQDFTGFFSPQESILRTWHLNYLPTQVERKRNDDINLIQHNRNPFVDYPQFIDRITSISNFSVAPIVPSIDLTEDTIVYGFVQSGISHVFHYVIVNKGNVDIHLSNFSLSHPGVLSFQSSGTNTALAPGEALGVDINLLTANQNAIHDSLVFNTDVPGHSLVIIPIYANDLVISGFQLEGESASLENLVELFPNPVDEKLFLTTSNSVIRAAGIYDVLGREVTPEMQIMIPSNSKTIDVSKLNRGIYFLFIQTNAGLVKKKFVKE